MFGMTIRTVVVIMAFAVIDANAQSLEDERKSEQALDKFLMSYKAKDNDMPQRSRLESLFIDNQKKNVKVQFDAHFAQQTFTDNVVKKIYSKVRKALSKPYRKYKVSVMTVGLPIEELIPDSKQAFGNMNNLWNGISYDGKPWVENVSRPVKFTHGLSNKHLSLWASHGKYYDSKSEKWKWQRPNLFCTNEDMFTQTIVVPYLIPMLENAGAVVFTPRERDWQKEEVIVDNDDPVRLPYYTETTGTRKWQKSPTSGFANTKGTYSDGDNPFMAGTCRMAQTSKKNPCEISYQPKFDYEGRHAVYVSYQTVPESIDDALYIVYHKGQRTEFHVNQTMGGGTWVYLGTFDFDKGCNEFNRVVVSNYNKRKGYVTSDAVRFGGGMGNIQRGGYTSGLPRSAEGARYYAQWAGMPYDVYSSKKGMDDYGDDINVRSLMTNWLGGGSCFMPTIHGLKVPFEMSLAVHSDAGFSNSNGIIGSLAICTTQFNDGRLNSGVSRMASRNLAEQLLKGVNRDIKYKYGKWNMRELLDKNYSETRLPAVPSAILETMSHQNFTDMMMGQSPDFRFTMARSIYKSIIRFVSGMHGKACVIEPLTPSCFTAEITSRNKVTLRWTSTLDKQEPTAAPTSYNVYTATGTGGFDNGRNTKNTNITIDIEPGVLYSFKVSAVNRGGESFTTQVLSVCLQPGAKKTILVIDGFDRVSSPYVINTATEQGFDISKDAGIGRGLTSGIIGAQTCYNKQTLGKEGPGNLGYGSDELAGKYIAGNDFNYVRTHAEAVSRTGLYNVVSCSKAAIESGMVLMGMYQGIDLILGLEKQSDNDLSYYKTFSPIMRQKLKTYAANNGRILISGAYVSSDMASPSEQDFLTNVLKLNYGGKNKSVLEYNDKALDNGGKTISGLGRTFNIHSQLNEFHYAAPTTDVLKAMPQSFCAMQYDDGTNAAVAYQGKDYKSFTMGFPFECIKGSKMRAKIMQGILNFIMN